MGSTDNRWTIRYTSDADGRQWDQGTYADKSMAEMNARLTNGARVSTGKGLTAEVLPVGQDGDGRSTDLRRVYDWLGRQARDARAAAAENELAINLDENVGQDAQADAFLAARSYMRHVDPSLTREAVDDC